MNNSRNKCLTLLPNGELSMGVLLSAKPGLRMLEVCMESVQPVHEYPLALDRLNCPSWSFSKGDPDPMRYLVVDEAVAETDNEWLTLAKPAADAPPSAVVYVAYSKRHILVDRPHALPVCFCPKFWGHNRGPFPDVGIQGSWASGEAIVSLDASRDHFITWSPAAAQSPIVVAMRIVDGVPAVFTIPHHRFQELGPDPSIESLWVHATSTV